MRLLQQGIHRGASLLAWSLALLLGLFAGVATTHAAEERYDYDPLGRLIRVIDEQGRVTEYVYDPAGNIQQVIGGTTAGLQAPVITTITPTAIRRDRVKVIQITGSGFQGLRVSVTDASIDISNLSVSATSVSFSVAVSSAAALGAHTVILTNTQGSASAAITVLPAISYVVTPNPIIVPPDNLARQFTITASEPDTEAVTFTAASNPAVARVGTTPLTLAAGQTQVIGTITPVAAGTTALVLNSPTFVDTQPKGNVLIYVTTDIANANVVRQTLGVVKGDPASPATNTQSGPVLAAPLGVIRGDPGSPSANTQSGPVYAAPLGVIKGDPASPSTGITVGPVMAPILGIEKP